MQEFITSDTHFGHKSILKYCPITRPYTDVTEMNNEMIKEWNSYVKEGDLVYHLGDFAFCNPNKAIDILQQLNGDKILIKGNHDSPLLKKSEFVKCFKSIHDILYTRYNNQKIVMCHYPILDWKNCAIGSIHLYGHRHGKPTGLEEYRAMDVGVDARGVIVSSLNDIVSILLERPIKPHH